MTDIVQDLIRVARMMDKHQLVSGNAGNMSAREGDRLWISGSGTVNLHLEPVSTQVADDFVRNTGYKPTLPRGMKP